MVSTPAISLSWDCLISPVPPPQWPVWTRTRVVLALDSRLLRDLLWIVLADEPGIEVVGSVVDPVDVLIVTGRTRAHVVILSWPTPGSMPGICTHLLAAFPQTHIIGVRADGLGQHSASQLSDAKEQDAISLVDLLAAIRTAAYETTGSRVGFPHHMSFSR